VERRRNQRPRFEQQRPTSSLVDTRHDVDDETSNKIHETDDKQVDKTIGDNEVVEIIQK